MKKKRAIMLKMDTSRLIACVFVFVVFLTGFLFLSARAQEVVTEFSEKTTLTKEEERARLERELAEIEKQIAEHEKVIQGNQAEQKSLKTEINTLTSRANRINLEIKAIEINLGKINDQITETQKHINSTENKIDMHKETLGKAVQDMYETDRQGMMHILILNKELSDFFGNVNNLVFVQNNLQASLEEIVTLRRQLLSQKQELSEEREDVVNLKAAQESQRRNVVVVQNQKTSLLKQTQGKESEYQKILAETKQTAAQIRSRIFRLLGGGELTFETAYQYAKLAEDATGVRAAMILAILQHESLLGKNVGQCLYFDASKNKYYMHPTRDVPVFLDIMKELGMDPLSIRVSCPNRDGTYGGAMGPAQFIPSTWKLYADDISRITHNNPPSPWRNEDAFVATGLYIRDSMNSNSCKNYSLQIPEQKQLLLERCAAAQYYAGGNWYNYRFVYGQPVLDNATRFQADINTITGR